MGWKVSHLKTKAGKTPNGKELERQLSIAELKILKEEEPEKWEEFMAIITEVNT
jgi:hypothetical protein